MKKLIIIPAYNEELSITNVVNDIRSHMEHVDIVVIDDGSQDDTKKAAVSAGVQVISLPFNLGIGGAMQAGYKFAEQHGYDIAIQFDADGQHRADQVESLLEPLLNHDADIVIGSRFHTKGLYEAERPRYIGIIILSRVISFLIKQRITDPSSGFRAVNRHVIKYFSSSYPDDYPEPEAIVLLHKKGYRIEEVPVLMEKRLIGTSSITLIRGLYYMVKVILAITIDMIKKY